MHDFEQNDKAVDITDSTSNDDNSENAIKDDNDHNGDKKNHNKQN